MAGRTLNGPPRSKDEKGTGSVGASHVPVMMGEVVEWLRPRPGAHLVDATVGLGGHAAALLGAAPGAELVGLDRDPPAPPAAPERLGRRARDRAGPSARDDAPPRRGRHPGGRWATPRPSSRHPYVPGPPHRGERRARRARPVPGRRIRRPPSRRTDGDPVVPLARGSTREGGVT